MVTSFVRLWFCLRGTRRWVGAGRRGRHRLSGRAGREATGGCMSFEEVPRFGRRQDPDRWRRVSDLGFAVRVRFGGVRERRHSCGSSGRHLKQRAKGRRASCARFESRLRALGRRLLSCPRSRRLSRLGSWGVTPSKRVCCARAFCATSCCRCKFLDSVLQFRDLGFVHFKRCGSLLRLACSICGAVCGFFPPVSHMMTTIKKARPIISHDWTFFGSRPGGFGAFSLNGFVHGFSLGNCCGGC